MMCAGECGILSQASFPVLDRSKVVPGTFDPDPGMVAALVFAGICGCCVVEPRRQSVKSQGRMRDDIESEIT